MTTWIFKADPRIVDVEAYLATWPGSIRLPVGQEAGEARAGDVAFVWRGGAIDEAKRVGIVAEAIVAGSPCIRSNDAGAQPFLRHDPRTPETMVELRLGRVELKDRLQRAWLDHDPVLTPDVVRRMDDGAVRLDDAQAARVTALWRRAKAGWTYAEALAGLWAFKRTLAGPISRGSGSAVAVAALRTGRVVQGMYNKVQHFRAMDPSDARKGLPSSSLVDRAVWSRFYDQSAGRLLGAEIEAEFERLWPNGPVDPVPSVPSALAGATHLLARSLTDLLARYDEDARSRTARPRTRRVIGTSFDRDPLVVAIARVRAQDRCEIADCRHPTFLTVKGRPYVEVHHIEPLSDGGGDTPENVACLCPGHHREAHHGASATVIGAALRSLRAADAERDAAAARAPA